MRKYDYAILINFVYVVEGENDFIVSGTLFLAVTGALLGVILIMTFMIAGVVFASVKYRYYGGRSKSKRHSMAGKYSSLLKISMYDCIIIIHWMKS